MQDNIFKLDVYVSRSGCIFYGWGDTSAGQDRTHSVRIIAVHQGNSGRAFYGEKWFVTS